MMIKNILCLERKKNDRKDYLLFQRTFKILSLKNFCVILNENEINSRVPAVDIEYILRYVILLIYSSPM